MSGNSAGGGAAALRTAASLGDVSVCQRYLRSARCVRFSRDDEGRSALHLAASNGHTAVVRLLLNVAAPKEVDSPDGAGCTSLQRAAADGHDEVLRFLLARGADVDKEDCLHGNTALHEAAWKGYSRCVRLLAAAGANLSKVNAGGFTALHLCCQNGHNQSCRELLLAGCNPDNQNNYGDTALHTSARYGHAGVIRILISAQCRVSEQNKNGDTALHIASAMGRRKLTRILLEAGCDKSVSNKQGETARDIALRKNLSEILDILDECFVKRDKKVKSKKRTKSKVRFEGKHRKDIIQNLEKPKHWSPYGCHYYPDPEAFPSPHLDSLPQEPLQRGEQYYLDLAGNICKGPVGIGYTCYCAPLFRHLEARMERDKRELQRAQVRLGQRVTNLEQKLNRGQQERRSERILGISKREQKCSLPRSRSLEMLDNMNRAPLQAARSMDQLEPPEEAQTQRPSVKELVARIQQQTVSNNNENNSESSDDEDSPLRLTQKQGPMGDSNMISLPLSLPNYENIPGDAPPRSRSGVYSPTTVNTTLIDSNTKYIEPIVKIQESNIRYNDTYRYNQPSTSKHESKLHSEIKYVEPSFQKQYYGNELLNPNKHYEYNLNTRLAKLRVLDSSKVYESKIILEGKSRMLETKYDVSQAQDTADRDTNNDSGYSTKVYGSSKGNSPSLSGHIEGECLGASSLV